MAVDWQSLIQQFEGQEPPDPDAFLAQIWPLLSGEQQMAVTALLRRPVRVANAEGGLGATPAPGREPTLAEQGAPPAGTQPKLGPAPRTTVQSPSTAPLSEILKTPVWGANMGVRPSTFTAPATIAAIRAGRIPADPGTRWEIGPLGAEMVPNKPSTAPTKTDSFHGVGKSGARGTYAQLPSGEYSFAPDAAPVRPQPASTPQYQPSPARTSISQVQALNAQRATQIEAQIAAQNAAITGQPGYLDRYPQSPAPTGPARLDPSDSSQQNPTGEGVTWGPSKLQPWEDPANYIGAGTAADPRRLRPGIPGMNYGAGGGVITEPVVGRGTMSGQGYQIGEAGPEMVIPVTPKTRIKLRVGEYIDLE